MISTIYLDTESVPQSGFYQEEVASKVKPPATYSKPESIAAWWDEKGEQAKQDAIHATGLMPAYAKIICLSWAWEDEDPTTYSGDSESGILECFFEDLSRQVAKSHNGYSTRFVGHNLIGFDLPLIWWGCLRNNIPYAFLPHPRWIRPWETTKVVDTLHILAGRDYKGMSLGNMAKLFKIHDPLPDVDGSMVWDMYKAGKYSEIGDYCHVDVEIVRELFKKMQGYLA